MPDVEDAVLLVLFPALREEVVELLLVELDEGHADAHVDLARPPGGLRENVLKTFGAKSTLIFVLMLKFDLKIRDIYISVAMTLITVTLHCVT